MGKACRLALSYGVETDPARAAESLEALHRPSPHDHIAFPQLPPRFAAKTTFTVKTTADGLRKHPTCSATHRDFWSWELIADCMRHSDTALLLSKYCTRFCSGDLPPGFKKYLSSGVLMAFHKDPPEIRALSTLLRHRPITIGSVLTRFPVRALLKLNREAILSHLISSHQFSFGVSGGPVKVAFIVTVGLQSNPSWVMMEGDFKNAHTGCARARILEELLANPALHPLIPVFNFLYGTSSSPLWHFGDGPGEDFTSEHLSVEGLRQGCAAASIFFNILAARVYRRLLAVLDGRGILVAVADDLKIIAPAEVIAEVAGVLPEIAWSEGGLEEQETKTPIFVPPTARQGWLDYLNNNPRLPEARAGTSLHDFDDGRVLEEPLSDRLIWPEADGVKLLGMPLGTPAYVKQFLDRKLDVQKRLLCFIDDVATTGFRREAGKMLRRGAVPRLTYIPRMLAPDDTFVDWAGRVDSVHRDAWLSIHGATHDINDSFTDADRLVLSASLDLPPQYGGEDLQSLSLSADEEHLGSWAANLAEIVRFLRSVDSPAYSALATVFENADVSSDEAAELGLDHPPVPAAIAAVQAASNRMHDSLDDIPDVEHELASDLTQGKRVVEVPGRDMPSNISIPVPLSSVQPRELTEYTSDKCKHEGSIIRQARHIRQVYRVYENATTTKKALLRGRAGQAGLDHHRCSHADVSVVADMSLPSHLRHPENSDDLHYAISTLQRQGLPFGGSINDVAKLPKTCPTCPAIMCSDADTTRTRPHEVLFRHQHHAGRCGGTGGAWANPHDVTKIGCKKGVWCFTGPGGQLFPASRVDIEPQHLRPDRTRGADLYVRQLGGSGKDIGIDFVVSSCTCSSIREKSQNSSDAPLKKAEDRKFAKDLASSLPFQNSATRRFVPFALNQFGRRGPHANALLLEFASALVLRSGGCHLTRGPFAMTDSQALQHIVGVWGARITWMVEREHAARILRSIESYIQATDAAFVPGPLSRAPAGPNRT